jgi:DNA repair protein RecO (recombination protein O)
VARISDNALVLESRPYRDRHLLLSLLTARSGLVRGIFRRARGGKAPRAAAAQTLSLVHATGFVRRNTELATFDDLELLRSSFPVAAELERAAAAAVIAELLITFCPLEEPAPRRFRLGVALLDALLDGTPPDICVAYGELWILDLAGLLPDIDDSVTSSRDRRFLERCRTRGVSELELRPSAALAAWLDLRVKEEAERPLRALEFFRTASGTTTSA